MAFGLSFFDALCGAFRALRRSRSVGNGARSRSPCMVPRRRTSPGWGGREMRTDTGRHPSDEASLLRVEGLQTWFPIRRGLMRRTTGWVQAATDISFEIAPGRTLALVGESGCGKTTVGRSILRLEAPQKGRVFFEGKDLMTLSRAEMRAARQRIQIIFQDPMASLDPRMRVRDQIAEGMKSFGIGANDRERDARVAELLERVQLDPDTMERYPHEFSGGQRQRICIARALAVEPRMIVCDESVSALDVSIQAQILNLLRDLQQDLGLSYLFITHDLSVVRYLAHEVAVMYLGEIVEEGPTRRIFESPAHPYTKGLLAAIPSIDPDHRGAAPPVLGDVPSPSDPPPGCHFHTRCPFVMDRCRKQAPPLFEIEGGRSRCFLSESPA
ncbi:MAG TPA: ABC transporter ATP-binding protein [Deltaproteobacteria bacterium]|nr:ABC transporter ATP-binding protein [Deltaproteobacteria bacterium]